MLPAQIRFRAQGFTLVELTMVISIVSVLLALVLGVARHVNATLDIRRAQRDLTTWHDALERWHLKFGEYPHSDLLPSTDPEINTPANSAPLTILTNQCRVTQQVNNGNGDIHFSSYINGQPSTTDPWGRPYIYRPSPNAQSFELYSLGPPSQHLTNIIHGTGAGGTR